MRKLTNYGLAATWALRVVESKEKIDCFPKVLRQINFFKKFLRKKQKRLVENFGYVGT